jgi:hypothetical protein
MWNIFIWNPCLHSFLQHGITNFLNMRIGLFDLYRSMIYNSVVFNLVEELK